MKDRLLSIAAVIAVVGIWVGAFLYFQQPGDTTPTAARPSATPSSSPSPTASVAVPTPTPSASETADAELRNQASQVEQQAQAIREADQNAVADLKVASFNVLGNSHTTGRDRQYTRYGSGPARVPGMIRALESNGVDVAGLQEFQPVQRAAFNRLASGWSSYPTGSAFTVGTTSVVWRTDRFDLVDARLTDMPFYDQVRPAPSVLLRDKQTGVQTWVTSVHNPADKPGFPRMQRYREAASERQVALMKDLTATGTSSIITGDMNEKASFFCRFAGQTGFTSPSGGSVSNGCNPPGDTAIDWILGGPAMQWTSFAVDNSSLVRRTSDHALRVAGVRLTGRPDSLSGG